MPENFLYFSIFCSPHFLLNFVIFLRLELH